MLTRNQTIAAVLLGIWLGWTVFMFFVAGVSFTTAERVFRNPNPALSQATQALSMKGTRSLFRYFAAELNRRVFAAYGWGGIDRKSTRLNSSHPSISYAVFCLKKKMPWKVFRHLT